MRRLPLALLLTALPALSHAAGTGTANSIGKVIGLVVFGWLVLKIVNRNKD